MTIEELTHQIDKIRSTIKKIDDDNLKFDLIEKFGSISKLNSSLIDITKSQKEINMDDFEKKKKLFRVAEEIRLLGKYSTHLDAFVRLLSDAPYTLPSNYFEPETALTTIIDLPRNNPRYKTEQTGLALQVCFPGSTTFRYGLPRKILCGDFSRNFLSDLRSVHEISDEPEEFQIGDASVYSVKTLKTLPVFGNKFFVCPICLSADVDEPCVHMTKKMVLRKAPSSFPIKEHAEVSRQSLVNSKSFPEPLNQIIEKITFLKELKIGTAYLGFTRTVGNVTNRIDYDPYIGYVTQTKSISFSIKKIDDEFLNSIMEQSYLSRDLIIDVVFNYFSESLKDNDVPRYHTELFLSSFIKALQLDRINNDFNYNEIIQKISSGDWVDTALNELHNEIQLYSGQFLTSDEKQTEIFQHIASLNLDTVILKNHLKKLIVNSIAHTLFLAGCTTSGSLYDDLDYSVNYEGDDPKEILLFDSANGGNGASELIYNYLTLPTNNVSKSSDVKEHLRPRYFDETFFEMLLPCSQGTIDRAHIQSADTLIQDIQLLKLLNHSKNIESQFPDTFKHINDAGIFNIVPLSIGLRQLDENQPIRETEKTREMASICIHGCPDCIALGSRAKPDQFSERYSISKYILDLFFKFKSSHLILDSKSSFEEIQDRIEKNGFAILCKEIIEVKDYDDLDNDISNLIGKEIKENIVKVAGKWYDCPISNNPHLVAYCILGTS